MYLQDGRVKKFVCTLEAQSEPTETVAQLDRTLRDYYPGDWELVVVPVAEDSQKG